ncbi:MAG: DNA polymerase III subunit delta [Candidatus Margulisbacteria bacterium]|nr:DNA polymerase III subunit delta [Candidatus Margulisiibacteriota bacterium]
MPKPIFLFYGDEDYLIGEKINALRQKAKEEGASIEQIDGAEPELETIINILQTNSLFAASKLVLIERVDLKDLLWDALIPVLGNLPASISVIFRASDLSKKAKLLKYVDEHGEVVEFKSYAEWEGDLVVAWIMRTITQNGKTIARPAAEKLLEVCGSGLCKLSSEIDKIITYVGDRAEITENDIISLAAPGESSVFALSKALSEKSLKDALTIFHQLYRSKVDLFYLLSLLASQYRVMLFALGSHPRERAPQEIARKLGGSPFFIRKCLENVGKYSAAELQDDLAAILEADLSLKSGSPPVPAMEMLFCSLCTGK